MGHYGSSGQPYLPDENDFGPFGPSGEPKNLDDAGGGDSGGKSEADTALAEFAGIGKRSKYSSLKAGGMDGHGEKITIPTKPQVGNA